MVKIVNIKLGCVGFQWNTISLFLLSFHCLPKGRHSEAAHEKRLLCAQKCTRVGWGGVGWAGVGHVGVGWGGSCRGGVGHSGVNG